MVKPPRKSRPTSRTKQQSLGGTSWPAPFTGILPILSLIATCLLLLYTPLHVPFLPPALPPSLSLSPILHPVNTVKSLANISKKPYKSLAHKSNRESFPESSSCGSPEFYERVLSLTALAPLCLSLGGTRAQGLGGTPGIFSGSLGGRSSSVDISLCLHLLFSPPTPPS